MPEPQPDPSTSLTSCIRRAQAGHLGSLEKIVLHLSPLLEAQARLRLGPHLQSECDPKDLVQEAWLVVLPRLGVLEPANGHLAPVLVKFMASTIAHKANNLLRRRIRARRGEDAADSGAPTMLDRCPADVTSVVTRIVRGERLDAVAEALAELPAADRKLLVLRLVEGVPNHLAATIIGEKPNTVAQRYRRLLDDLRRRVPDGLMDDWDGG